MYINSTKIVSSSKQGREQLAKLLPTKPHIFLFWRIKLFSINPQRKVLKEIPFIWPFEIIHEPRLKRRQIFAKKTFTLSKEVVIITLEDAWKSKHIYGRLPC